MVTSNSDQYGAVENTSADVAAIFLTYSLSGAILSRVLGKLWDLVGWVALIVSNVSAAIIVCTINIYNLLQEDPSISFGLCILNGVLFACVDFGANSLVNMTISQQFSNRASAMFGLYRALMSSGVVVGSLFAGTTSKQVLFGVNASVSFLAAVCYILSMRIT